MSPTDAGVESLVRPPAAGLRASLTGLAPRLAAMVTVVATAACTTVSPSVLSSADLPRPSRQPASAAPGVGTVDPLGPAALGSSTDATGEVALPPGASHRGPQQTTSASLSGVQRARCTTPVRIGVSYSSDVGTAIGTLGGGAASGRAANYAEALKRMYQLGADDLNRRGGLAGCRVVLEYHDFKVASADGNDGQSQQECADFADDKKVFAVFPAWLESKVLVTCLHQKGVVVFPGQEMTFLPTTKDFAAFRGTLYGPTHIAVDRLRPIMDILHRQGFFGQGAKVGVLIDDDSDGTNRHLANRLWIPRLRALNVEVASTFTYAHGDTSWMNAAVLQFKGAGVTHVVTTADSGGAVILFTPVADSQGYYPRLGLTSISGAQKLKLSFLPKKSKTGAMAVSWWLYDFAAGDGVGWDKPPANPARERCVRLYKDAAAANGIGITGLFAWCDMLEVLRTALADVSGPPTRAALLLGVDGLQGRFRNAAGFEATLLGRGRYDGGDLVRVMTWNDSKQNWAYVSGPRGLNG